MAGEYRRPWVAINGQNSSTIPGLIITRTPDITRPAMREEIIEIDGLPGEIPIPLGYAAYDKTFAIGLKDGADVDQIIAWLSQTGQITFSNEPDKYYHFRQTAQIDLGRLVRYRVADVTVRTQPYKYALNEPTIGAQSDLAALADKIDIEHGMSVTVQGGEAIVSGTNTTGTTALFYLPFTASAFLAAGKRYGFYAASSETPGAGVKVGLATSPTAEGEQWLTLPAAGGTPGIAFTAAADTTYTGIVVSVPNTTDFRTIRITPALIDTAANQISVTNQGNTQAQPTLQLKGLNTVRVYVGNQQILSVDFGGSGGTVIVDSEQLEAVWQDGRLANRAITGDYAQLRLQPGSNRLILDGIVIGWEIVRYSRWL